MTPSQAMRAEGMAAALEVRGIPLCFGSRQFIGLVEPAEPESGNLTLSDENRTAVLIHVTRTDGECMKIGVGDVIETVDGSFSYRVTRVVDQAPAVSIRYLCESSRP